MKVKLDENLGSLGGEFPRQHGIDVLTVADQGLLTSPDDRILSRWLTAGAMIEAEFDPAD